jgi:amidase
VLKDSLIARDSKKGLGYTDYLDNIETTTALSQGDILKVMEENNLDALIYPATRRPPETIGRGQIGRNAMLAAFSGFPALVVPAGFTTDGLPVDVEFLGRPYSEPTLIKLGYSFEQGTQFRRPPSLPIR